MLAATYWPINCDITTKSTTNFQREANETIMYLKKCFIKNLYNTNFWILCVPAISVWNSVILSEQMVLKWQME